jgi:death-on-curing protein
VVGYLSVAQVLALHSEQLQRYGGTSGLRDRAGLESAVARPAMTFGGEDLYDDPANKAAALMHSLALNRPFVDWNKRVAAHAAIVFVTLNGSDFTGGPDELIQVTLAVARGALGAEALAIWFRQRLRTPE